MCRPDISEEELEESSSTMGYGAVKYADLKSNRTTNYKFSFDDMLSLNVSGAGRRPPGGRLIEPCCLPWLLRCLGLSISGAWRGVWQYGKRA